MVAFYEIHSQWNIDKAKRLKWYCQVHGVTIRQSCNLAIFHILCFLIGGQSRRTMRPLQSWTDKKLKEEKLCATSKTLFKHIIYQGDVCWTWNMNVCPHQHPDFYSDSCRHTWELQSECTFDTGHSKPLGFYSFHSSCFKWTFCCQ